MPYSEDELANMCAAPGCTNQLPEPEPRQRTRTYGLEAEPGTDMRSTRRQRLTCSAACRKRLQRARQGYQKPFKPCRFCGELIDSYRGNDVRCPEDDRSDYCDDLQWAKEERQARLEARKEGPVECEGPNCTAEVVWSGRGRPRRFCSGRCRMAAVRARRRGEETQK
ncbi:hypothetical protein GCM10009549_29820 [Streptomyces thermoalcalitolerans]|uniref:Uncharacterized protein n=1 Tax=Streptomyces thermoalcalitolerans TaxID=65605 RepID=A0ABN1NS22_9ACTN